MPWAHQTAPAVLPEAHDGEAHHLGAAARHGGAAGQPGQAQRGADGGGGDGQRQGDADDHGHQNAHEEGLQLRGPHDGLPTAQAAVPMAGRHQAAKPTPTRMVTMGVTRMSIFVSLD